MYLFYCLFISIYLSHLNLSSFWNVLQVSNSECVCSSKIQVEGNLGRYRFITVFCFLHIFRNITNLGELQLHDTELFGLQTF